MDKKVIDLTLKDSLIAKEIIEVIKDNDYIKELVKDEFYLKDEYEVEDANREYLNNMEIGDLIYELEKLDFPIYIPETLTEQLELEEWVEKKM